VAIAPSNVNPLTGSITDNLNAAWAYTVANCTRFVAGALAWIPAGLGDAKDWLANARAKGLPTIGPTSSPPAGSVAVWNTGAFGHVAEVVGTIPGGFRVAEENWKGLGITDVRDVTGAGLQGLQGFILSPGTDPAAALGVGGVAGLVGSSAASAVATLPQAVAGLPASVGHGLADAAGAGVANVGIWVRNQIVPLVVALVVALVLWSGR
jgi:CHAP domain